VLGNPSPPKRPPPKLDHHARSTLESTRALDDLHVFPRRRQLL